MRTSAVRVYGDVVQVAHVFEHLLVLFVPVVLAHREEHPVAQDDRPLVAVPAAGLAERLAAVVGVLDVDREAGLVVRRARLGREPDPAPPRLVPSIEQVLLRDGAEHRGERAPLATGRREAAWAVGQVTEGLRSLFSSEARAAKWFRNGGLEWVERVPPAKSLLIDYATG